MSFTILPAIDLQGGKCVRLRQGRAEDSTVYSDDPAAMAQTWAAQGARYLHVVDLDGAFQGRPAHLEVFRRIAAILQIPFEVGGGLRTDADLDAVLQAGADRVILGTRACESVDAVTALARKHGPKLAVGIDARDGFVQVKGWTETTGLQAVDLARRLADAGVQTIIYTDTSRDGMLAGVNAAAMSVMCAAVGCDVIASGGVTTAEDVRRLCALGHANLRGAIVGKALYEGRVKLADLMQATTDTQNISTTDYTDDTDGGRK